MILKAKTRSVQWGGLLEERWFLAQVCYPSLHHKTVSILYGTELSQVRNVGIEILCPLKGGRWWSGLRAQGSIPGRQCYCLLGSFKWSCGVCVCVCMCVCVCECMLSRVQIFVTPWTVAQGFPLEWGAISFSRGFSQPRGWTRVSCTDRWVLCHSATWEVELMVGGTKPWPCF